MLKWQCDTTNMNISHVDITKPKSSLLRFQLKLKTRFLTNLNALCKSSLKLDFSD